MCALTIECVLLLPLDERCLLCPMICMIYVLQLRINARAFQAFVVRAHTYIQTRGRTRARAHTQPAHAHTLLQLLFNAGAFQAPLDEQAAQAVQVSNVFVHMIHYCRMCSLTVECVLLLPMCSYIWSDVFAHISVYAYVCIYTCTHMDVQVSNGSKRTHSTVREHIL